MKLKGFSDSTDPNANPFDNISDEHFEFILKQGFEPSKLDCYASLDGEICYAKSISGNFRINCYITENGIAVDQDYNCGGNMNHETFWFDEGEYEVEEFSYVDGDSWKTYTKIPHTFEEAWNKMINLVNGWK